MSVAWGKVRARLAEALPGVVGPFVRVFDGPVVTGENPAAALTIAYAPSLETSSVGRFTQETPDDGWAANETGFITCELAAVSGSSTVPDVFTTFDAVASWLQGDPTLGGTLTRGSTCTAAADVVQEQSQGGSAQRLIITISYFTRLAQ